MSVVHALLVLNGYNGTSIGCYRLVPLALLNIGLPSNIHSFSAFAQLQDSTVQEVCVLHRRMDFLSVTSNSSMRSGTLVGSWFVFRHTATVPCSSPSRRPRRHRASPRREGLPGSQKLYPKQKMIFRGPEREFQNPLYVYKEKYASHSSRNGPSGFWSCGASTPQTHDRATRSRLRSFTRSFVRSVNPVW